jgi:hypothetical protein
MTRTLDQAIKELDALRKMSTEDIRSEIELIKGRLNQLIAYLEIRELE